MLISFLPQLKERFLMLFFILLLLSGCGQPSSTQNPQKTPVSIHCESTTPTSGQAPLGTSIAFDLGGCLHIQSAPGFTCRFYNIKGSFTPGTLILPTVQPTYDQGTLQQMKKYVTDSFLAANYGYDAPYPAFSWNSNAFQLLAVSGVNSHNSECSEVLHVTNVGSAPVQISKISAQLTTDTQTNNQHYNLIDTCSLLSVRCYFQIAAQESVYVADFALHSGKIHTIISATLGSSGCLCQVQAITLHPGEIAKVVLVYHASDRLFFSLVPSFILDWPGEQITSPALQLQERFAFASTSQFSCYTLQGQQFTEVSLEQHWCI